MCVEVLAPPRKLRLVGYPDVAYRNNTDNSSQRGQTFFLADERKVSKDGLGSMIDFDSHKINRVVLSTSVSELYSFTKCFGTCQFLRGLWVDISAACVAIHMRTDAINLVTTASTTRLPEQKENYTHNSNYSQGFLPRAKCSTRSLSGLSVILFDQIIC